METPMREQQLTIVTIAVAEPHTRPGEGLMVADYYLRLNREPLLSWA